jgi:hypothetical protein
MSGVPGLGPCADHQYQLQNLTTLRRAEDFLKFKEYLPEGSNLYKKSPAGDKCFLTSAGAKAVGNYEYDTAYNNKDSNNSVETMRSWQLSVRE